MAPFRGAREYETHAFGPLIHTSRLARLKRMQACGLPSALGRARQRSVGPDAAACLAALSNDLLPKMRKSDLRPVRRDQGSRRARARIAGRRRLQSDLPATGDRLWHVAQASA